MLQANHQRADHCYQYRRVIRPDYIVGVEELLINTHHMRVFDVRVKSSDCEYYKIKSEVDMGL